MTQDGFDWTQISQALPREAAEWLRQIGIRDADFTQLFHVSFRDLIEGILGLFRGDLAQPLRFLCAACCMLVLLTAASAAGGRDSRAGEVRELACTALLIVSCALPLEGIVAAAVTALKAVGGFVRALIPVLAAMIAASGDPVLSVCWQTALFSAAQTVTAAASGFMAPCCGLMLGMGVLDCLLPDSAFGETAQRLRKAAVWIFSAMATLFTAFLSLKGVLAVSADTLSAKGIRLAVSSFVPVVGAQLSEAYASVLGALRAARSTAGVFAIAGICAVTLPAVCRVLLWQVALEGAKLAADLLGHKSGGKLFHAFSGALSVLLGCLLFATVLYVLSVGIILRLRSGV